MQTLTTFQNDTIQTPTKTTTRKQTPAPQEPRGYWAYCDRQEKNKYIWFALPALALPCVFMPPAVYVMLNYNVAGFSAYLFVAMLLFIGGLVANVGGLNTRVTITLFWTAVVWNILFPVLSLSLFG